VLYGLFQKHERFDRISTSLIIRSSTSLVAVVVVMVATGSVLLVCSAIAVIWLLALIIYDVDRAKRLLASHPALDRYTAIREWLPFGKPQMRALAKLAFPMGIVMLLIALNLNIPRLVIERDLGIRQPGYFGAMAYPVFTGSLAVFALGEATIPQLSREFLNAPRQFVRVWCRLLLTATLIGIAGIVIVAIWGSDLLRVLYGPGYGAVRKSLHVADHRGGLQLRWVRQQLRVDRRSPAEDPGSAVRNRHSCDSGWSRCVGASSRFGGSRTGHCDLRSYPCGAGGRRFGNRCCTPETGGRLGYHRTVRVIFRCPEELYRRII
jgi:hypothetical protein